MVVSGIIRPPPEIRAVANKTASYVAKNGRAFESRILGSAKGKTPKFSFLQPTSPFHSYYEHRIQFYEGGGKDEDEDEAADATKKADDKAQERVKEEEQEASKNAVSKKQKASAIDPVAKMLLKQRERIQRSRISKQKETNAVNADDANGDAKEGDQATATTPEVEDSKPAATPEPQVEEVSMKPLKFEAVNIMPPSNLTIMQVETIQLVAQFTAMDLKGGPFLHHLSLKEWNNPTFTFCQPRNAHFPYFSALVDVYRGILRDITNTSDEKPKSVQSLLEEAAYTAEYERDRKDNSGQEDGGVLAIDWHDFVVVETIDFPIDEVVLPPPPPPPTPAAETSTTQHMAKSPSGVNAMDESDSDNDDGEQIRVVPSYQPKVVGTTNVQNARAIDPITGKSVAVSDMPEHMRIQLLDPKWAEEKKKFQDKQKDSNLVGDDVVAANISRFTAARGDMFQSSNNNAEDDAAASKKRSAEDSNNAVQVPPAAAGPVPTRASSNPPVANADRAAKRPRFDQGAPTNLTKHAPKQVEPLLKIDPDSSRAEDTPAVDEKKAAEPKTLLPADEFAASLSTKEVTLQIRIPNDSSQMAWNFYGQTLSVTVGVMSTVKSIKKELSSLHLNKMPANKIQLKDPASGFLKDSHTLAHLNIGPTATLDLSPKTRGGRK